MIKAVRFAATFAAAYIAHPVADYWIQTDNQAAKKGDRGREGAAHCARHVATYTATSALCVAAANSVTGMRLPLRSHIALQVVSATTHYFFDRRWTANKIYNAIEPITGTSKFLANGGAAHLDQAWHIFWLGVGAATAAAISEPRGGHQ